MPDTGVLELDDLDSEHMNLSRVRMGQDYNFDDYNPTDTVSSAPGMQDEEEEPFPGNEEFDPLTLDDDGLGMNETQRRLIDQIAREEEAAKPQLDAIRRRRRPSIPTQVHEVDDPVEAEFQDLVHGKFRVPDPPDHPLHAAFSDGIYPESYHPEQDLPTSTHGIEQEIGTPEQILAGINPHQALHDRISNMDVENEVRKLADPDIYFDTKEQIPLNLNEVWSDETVLDQPIEDAKKMLRMHLGLVKDPSDSLPDTGPEDTWNDPIITQVTFQLNQEPRAPVQTSPV